MLQISVNGRPRTHYRLAYEELVGPIPDDTFVCHSCDERSCFNPDHLFLGTPADNSADMRHKGRQAKGPRIGGSKLTESQVVAIRRDTRHARTVAAEYGVHRTLIQMIRKRQVWRHVA